MTFLVFMVKFSFRDDRRPETGKIVNKRKNMNKMRQLTKKNVVIIEIHTSSLKNKVLE